MLSDLLQQAADEAKNLEQRILTLEMQQEQMRVKRKEDKEQIAKTLSNLIFYLSKDD